nr:uncharacterized protein LOC128705920 isoform X2 [Cherax quadricarinatus]
MFFFQDEDGFDGFLSCQAGTSEVKTASTTMLELPVRKAGKRSAQKVEEACAIFEKEGLVTRGRTSVVQMTVKELSVSSEKKKDLHISGVERTEKVLGYVEPASDNKAVVAAPPSSSSLESDQFLEEKNTVVVSATSHVTRKQTNHRISRPPTVKTALAKKLLAKAKKKMPSLPVVGEKSPKRFILPTMSVRSSRIIKPNKRLFADITEMCSTSSSLMADTSTETGEDSVSVPSKRLVKLTRKGRGSHTQFLSLPRSRAQSKNSLSGTEGVGRDRMRRTISLYTASITGVSKGQVGRPPKRLLRRYEAPMQEVEAEAPDSPQRCDPKESRVKEKIEKLLRSPWDDRLKQSGKGGKIESDELLAAPASSTSPALSASVLSRNILRKARLNLNKTTLQKIRNPASLQRLIPMCDEGSVEGKCAICDLADGNSRKFGIVFCEICSNFLHNASDGPREVFECQGSKGECQFQGYVEEDRCLACWLSRILVSCSMPSLLHDRLRKRLPTILKEHIPTSLARCMNVGGLPIILEKDADLASHTKRLPLDPGGGGAFGSVMDLPGGWRRKTGPEVVVISPSGEKFKSVQKLEEFLKKQGISTDARVLFGNNSPAVCRSSEVKSRPSVQSNISERGKVVMTTLPGGWIRRIKWRSAGDRFDTYVYSPDGRTFRSRRELSAYFQLIGKVDDIHKYFPVVTGHSDASVPSSSDTPGSSSTEPVSSSESCSEISSDDKSPEASECEVESSKSKNKKSGSTHEKVARLSYIKDLKSKNYNEQGRCRSKSGSKLKTTDNSGEDLAGKVSSVDIKNEGKNMERKYKKAKVIMRSRSMSIGRNQNKCDTSFTDTTESESEQKKSGTVMVFPKAFSRSRSKNTSKSIESPSLSEKSTHLSDTHVEITQEINDTDVVEEIQDFANVSPNRKRRKTEEGPVPVASSVEVSERKPDPKIVLKIPKKVIKPLGRKHRLRNKIVDSDPPDVGLDDKQSTEQQVLQDNTKVVQDKNIDMLAQVPSTNKSLDEAQGKLFNNDQNADPIGVESEPLVEGVKSSDSKVSLPNVSEGEVVPDSLLVPEFKSKSKPKRLSVYQTCHFGNGWSRKIRWNEKGEGKVALLHSPDSQTFRSRIELLAYFKKAGRSKVDLDFYFPPVLKREQTSLSSETKVEKDPITEISAVAEITSTSAQSSEVSEFSDTETLAKTSEDSCASGEESKKPRITKAIKCFRKSGMQPGFKNFPETVTEEITFSNLTAKVCDSIQPLLEEPGKHIAQLGKSGRKVIIVSTQEGKSSVKSETEEGEGPISEVGGPRVKHVCRSQAQVLGIPRAVFPSPRKDEDRLISSASVPIRKGNQKRKIVTVTTTASGKVLRKTQWCNKCPGCTTPNCLKCSNCLDMKKYGGPGTKKKPCIMRKCHNPRLSMKSAISQESTSKVPLQVTSTTVSSPTIVKETRKAPVINIKVPEEKTELPEVSSESVCKSSQQEKGVFVPRQVTRTLPDQKDRGDIAAGKQFVPGALVNIDYWQGYDADEMMLTGYPVTTASSLHPQVLCFRCGSVGKEQLIYCAWCCEGIHPYCLEDGEGPESEAEEIFWICRRCAVCQVCGAPGADSLLRCSDCRNYYHLECLGPSAHSTCQPTPDRPWKCVRCTRCTSCGSPNVAQWQKVSDRRKSLEVTTVETSHTVDLVLCARCVTLRERGNFCPLCNGCYEDDDYDAKMMECGRCGEWIHANCEGLNNERYQILSFLPDTVEYVCRNCVMDASSTWLDAVGRELLAGCEAVLQALLNSRCAKHLVRREVSIKLSSTGGLTPVPSLPAIGTPSLERNEEGLLENLVDGESLVLVAHPMEPNSTAASLGYLTGELLHSGKSDTLRSEKGISPLPSKAEGIMEFSCVDQVKSSVVNIDVDFCQVSCHSTMSASEKGKNVNSSLCSVNVDVKESPQDKAVALTNEPAKQMCTNYSNIDNVAANINAGKSGCIIGAKHKTDLKGKSSKEKCEEEVPAFPRRQTRSSLAGAALSSTAASSSASTDPIKLKECSVRLEDICKSKSPSSSPIKTQGEQDNILKLEVEPWKESESVKSQEVEASTKSTYCKALVCLESLEAKDLEGVTREALQGIKALKDTDVSCTQVDGPNDETTATSRVIRNLFFEERNQIVLDSTNLLESKKENNLEKALAQVEAQLISPKDKITKDIDDDCVSSEESSFCDTDTEIESIQDDPEEPRDLLSIKEKLKERKYESVLQFHVDMARVIENGRHLNRSQTRNVQATYAKHMKECFPWFDVKTPNVFELVDKQRPFPIPHLDHTYIFRTMMAGNRHFTMRDAPIFRKRSTSPLKGTLLSQPDRRKCVLCGRESDDEPNAAGRLLYLGQDEWLHVNCGLWSSEVYEEVDGGLQNVYLAVSRGRLIKCSACLERGATVGCCHKTCQATYHFLCARRSCCQFMEDKRIFCPQHESTLNGEEKSDDFKVSRCVYVDMDSEKKKWKQVPGNRVSIAIGSLNIKNLGRIVPESDSAEALIPMDFTCSRVYWSTVDPTRRVSYTCRTRRVVPTLDDASLMADAAFHKTIDHSLGEETVYKEMAAVKKWFKQLEERKVEKKSRETNIIPPHLCPLYRSIREREEEKRAMDKVVHCPTPPAIVELDVQQCIDDIIDKVSRSVEEESLLLDTDLPAIVSADDNELISMVLNDLDACDPITLQSTPSTSGRPSPLDIDFLSTCDHMMDSGKVNHSGNMIQEAQETECDPQVILDATLSPGCNPAHDTYQVESPNADIKEPIIETVSPPTTQDLGSVPSSSMSLSNASNSNTQSSGVNDSNSNVINSGNSCNTCNSESKSDSTSGSSSSSSSSESSSSSNMARESSSPERCSEGTASNTSSPDTSSRTSSDINVSNDTNNGSTDSNSGSETSQGAGCGAKTPCTSSGKTSSLKQICRVLPMLSTNSRRSSSASEHSDSVPQTGLNQSPLTSQQTPRNSDENEGSNATGRGNVRKKICMKRNYKTVIKKYPLRSGMRKSKPYETVQIEINETIEIPGGEGSGVVHKSLKRKWSGILDSEEEEHCQKDSNGDQAGKDNTSRGSDGENSKENSVSKKVLKFTDDNNDITVSIVNNNNNLCEFSKSRGHRYRHKTVLQLDGAADGSSSSAEMSESQDEGVEERYKSQNQEDPQTPPLHSALAMRIKEQSLARSSPGEEGPYKCAKCKRLYRCWPTSFLLLDLKPLEFLTIYTSNMEARKTYIYDQNNQRFKKGKECVNQVPLNCS